MPDTQRRIAVVARDIEGTDIHGGDVTIDPGRYPVLDSGHDWPGVTVVRVEVDGRPQAVSVKTQDITVEEVDRG